MNLVDDPLVRLQEVALGRLPHKDNVKPSRLLRVGPFDHPSVAGGPPPLRLLIETKPKGRINGAQLGLDGFPAHEIRPPCTL